MSSHDELKTSEPSSTLEPAIPPVQPPLPPQPPQPQYQQPYPTQPPYGGQPAMPYTQPMENPGQTTGIIGLVLNFLGINIGGIILGAISRSKSKAANMSTTLGTVSLVWGVIGIVIGVITSIFVFLVILAAANGA